jgi:uncharacterized membrane protein
MKKLWSGFAGYFMRGLVFITPIAVTIFLISGILSWVRNRFPETLGVLWALAIVAASVFAITFLGYLGTKYFSKPIVGFFEYWLAKIPLVNTIYSSTKDMVNSFFGDNKKFDKPVLVQMSTEPGIEKLGFVTQQSLESLGLTDRVAVYFPISYSVAGDLYVVSPNRIKVLDISSSDMMRFLISGGLTDPDKLHHPDLEK